MVLLGMQELINVIGDVAKEIKLLREELASQNKPHTTGPR